MSSDTKDILETIYWCISLGILCATVYYIANGPRNAAENAVRIGRQLNTEQQKDNAKRNLFLTLYALRGSPLNYDFVRGLNQIDIVFEDVPAVLDAWHIHYASLNIKGQINEIDTWNLQRVNLLSAMASHLGYERIRQTEMIRDYYPEGHETLMKGDIDFRLAALEYLKKGAELYSIAIDNQKPKDQPEATQS